MITAVCLEFLWTVSSQVPSKATSQKVLDSSRPLIQGGGRYIILRPCTADYLHQIVFLQVELQNSILHRSEHKPNVLCVCKKRNKLT